MTIQNLSRATTGFNFYESSSLIPPLTDEVVNKRLEHIVKAAMRRQYRNRHVDYSIEYWVDRELKFYRRIAERMSCFDTWYLKRVELGLNTRGIELPEHLVGFVAGTELDNYSLREGAYIILFIKDGCEIPT